LTSVTTIVFRRTRPRSWSKAGGRKSGPVKIDRRATVPAGVGVGRLASNGQKGFENLSYEHGKQLLRPRTPLYMVGF